jgi:protein ImuA
MIRTRLSSDELRRLSAQTRPGDSGNRITLGVAALDDRLEGGLARGDLHELFAGSVEDSSTAAGFALMLTLRGARPGQPVIWIREGRCIRQTGRLHAPGLVELGLDPRDVILIDADDTLAVLRAGADAVKCGPVGAVVIEPWGKARPYDLTASRRLAMAAKVSGVTTLVVRAGADPLPSAAQTRWLVTSAESLPLPADAPGHPAFDITLLRHRGGIAGLQARLEWNRETRSFAPLPGRLPAVAAVGTDQAPTFERPIAA